MKMRAWLSAVLVAGTLPLVGATPSVTAQSTGALVDDVACSATSLSANDDGSTGAVPLGFTADFYGTDFSSVFVNNNGNVTFDSRLSTYTPFPLSSVTRKIIAPFFGDVDTRGIGSDILRYGHGRVVFEGRPAFCATWKNVGYYSRGTNKLNSFQLLLVDRSDRGAGDFDIVFNYDKIQWESGSASGGSNGLGGSAARAGFSNGSGEPGTSYEVPGSGFAGAFLDSASNGLSSRSLGSSQPGRQVYAVTGGQPSVGLNSEPIFENWHAGDVHVHAAGDTSLDIHPKCVDRFSDVEQADARLSCARSMVSNTLERSDRFDTEWLIFTEHTPWLGYRREGLPYNFEQGEAQWNAVREAIDLESTSEVRGLIGTELGTAFPACTEFDKDFYFDVGQGEAGVDITVDNPGHYGVYYTPEAINQSVYDCDETGPNGYVDDVAAVGGFGGINHPENESGVSAWDCYTSREPTAFEQATITDLDSFGGLVGAEKNPIYLREKPCRIGIDHYAAESPDDDGAMRSMEIISGRNMPTRLTLDKFDMFLQNGYRIAAVGGGDGHTAPRDDPSLLGAATCAVLQENIGDCIDRGAPANEKANSGLAGGSARTLAYYTEDLSTGLGYDSNLEDDPVRRAIRNGETVATNGPKVVAQVEGEFPGGEVSLASNDPVELRIDWLDEWKWSGDILRPDRDDIDDFSDVEAVDFFDPQLAANDFNTQDDLSSTTPDEIVVVIGERDQCGADPATCGEQVERLRFTLDDNGDVLEGEGLDVNLADNNATVMVAPPVDGYMRVEMYWEDDLSVYTMNDFVAITSPIYVSQDATAPSDQITYTGTIRDYDGNVLAGAIVEFCRTSPNTCVTRITRADGSFEPVVGLAGTWTARAFPPSGRNDLDKKIIEFAPIARSINRIVDIELPVAPSPLLYIDPSGVVVDSFGQPIEGADVVLLHSDNMIGPFTPVEDGSAVMSPSNRTNPDLTNESGEFAWDVLAGWYKVSASYPGCVSEAGASAATTVALQVPPPALNLELVLDCRAPDTTAPIIEVSGPDYTNTPEATLGVTLTGEDDYAIASCDFDGEPVRADETDTRDFPDCGSAVTVTNLSEGEHTLRVIAFDDHTNASTASKTLVADFTAPDVSISGLQADGVYSTTAVPSPSCTATDDLSGLANDCEGTLTSPEGVTGVWTYTATATDRAGNTTETAVQFVVEQSPAALWSSTPGASLSVNGRITAAGVVHSEGSIDIAGNSTLTGGAEFVDSLDLRGNTTIEPAASQVEAGVIPQQLREIEQWRPTHSTSTAVPAPQTACDAGTWKPTPADLTAEMISVPCDVEIGTWRFNEPITTTIVADGEIVVRGSNVEFDTAQRPSLMSTGENAAVELRASGTTIGPIVAAGPVSLHGSNIVFNQPTETSVVSTGSTANIEIRASNVTAHGAFSDGQIEIHGSNVSFIDTVRPSLVSTGIDTTIELRSSNLTLNGGVLTNGSISLHGSRADIGCGIYAALIEIRGSNHTITACPQR